VSSKEVGDCSYTVFQTGINNRARENTRQHIHVAPDFYDTITPSKYMKLLGKRLQNVTKQESILEAEQKETPIV
jgi:hypothetical protein